MKLNPKILQTFDTTDDMMDDTNLNFDISYNKVKKSAVIIEVKKSKKKHNKFQKDVSTRLF